MTSEIIWWLMVILAFVLAFVIGANDAANALGASYGSKATKLIYLLILGALFELIGAALLSHKLAGTLVYKMIPMINVQPIQTQERMMLGTSVASFIFILAASLFGMPISTTHSDVGALIGAGLAGSQQYQDLNWKKVGQTAMSWVLSPVVSGGLAASLFIIVCFLTLDGNNFSASRRLLNLTIISAISCGLSSFMVMGLISRSIPFSELYLAVIGIGLAGLLASRFILALKSREISQRTFNVSSELVNMLKVWTVQDIIPTQTNLLVNDELQTVSSQLSDQAFASELIKEVYRILLVANACLVCLAHGSNDVANSISPMIVVMQMQGEVSKWPYWLGGIGIALGLLCLGYIVMETLGKKVLKMDFYKGFSCQFATANCIILGTRLGLPLSTTHCAVGSIFGIACASKLKICISAYQFMHELPKINNLKPELETEIKSVELNEPLVAQEEVKALNEESVNVNLLTKIFMLWMATVPIAMGSSFVLTWVFLRM